MTPSDTRCRAFFSRGSAMTLFARNLMRWAIAATASACSSEALSSLQNASAACCLRSGGKDFHSCDGRGMVETSGMSARYVNIAAMPKLTVEGFQTVDVDEDKRLVLAIEQNAGVDILHACGGNARCTTCRVEFISGEPARMTKAEKMKLEEKGLSGIRLSCQIVCDHDMAVRAISRLEGSGRPDPGKTPEATIQPPPEWVN